LPILTHPDHHQERDRGGLLVEPDSDDSAVEDQPDDRLVGERALVPGLPVSLHLAPDPADRVLADGSAEQGGKRPAHPPGVGARQISGRDQRIRRLGAPLISPERPAAPLGGGAILGVQAGPWHGNLGLTKGAGQAAAATAMTVAVSGGGLFVGSLAAIARPAQSCLEFRLNEGFDPVPHPLAHTRLDRVDPIVEKPGLRLPGWMHRM
jgi:hypothetical protein